LRIREAVTLGHDGEIGECSSDGKVSAIQEVITVTGKIKAPRS
jgi:hypothetical protein